MAHAIPRIEPYVVSDDREGWLVSCPWHPGWLDEMKAHVPHPDRRWFSETKKWWVAAEHEDIVRHLLHRYFGDVAEADEDGNTIITTARGERLSQGGLGL